MKRKKRRPPLIRVLDRLDYVIYFTEYGLKCPNVGLGRKERTRFRRDLLAAKAMRAKVSADPTMTTMVEGMRHGLLWRRWFIKWIRPAIEAVAWRMVHDEAFMEKTLREWQEYERMKN